MVCPQILSGLIGRYQSFGNQAEGRSGQHEPSHSAESPGRIGQIEHHQDLQADQRELSCGVVADDSLLPCRCTFWRPLAPPKKSLVEYGTTPIKDMILLWYKPFAKSC